MSLKNSEEKDVTVLPPDVQLISTILENAEIYGEEEVYLDEIRSIKLENGIIFNFSSNGNLEEIEIEPVG